MKNIEKKDIKNRGTKIKKLAGKFKKKKRPWVKRPK